MKFPVDFTILKTCIVLTIVSLLFQCGIFDSENEAVPDIDAEIQAEMETLGIPSVVAGIIKDGEMVWQKAYGYADVQQNILATTNTNYTLMSVSKTVLATAITQVWEQGRIELDEDINQYLPFSVRNPKFPNKKITTRMLMTHTSGLAHPDNEVPNWYRFYPDDQTPGMSDWIDQWIIPGGSHYVSDVWKNWEPGTRELYSNIGTWLLAYLIERISGEEFTAYCEKHIFEPLEMVNTSYWLADLDSQNLATPYVEGYRSIDQYNTIAYPVGWLRSSVNEFSHFLIAYMNQGVYNGKRILEVSTINKMFEVQNSASGVCLIWYKWLGEWYGHNGGGTGFSSCVQFNREDNIGIIILSNTYRESIDLVTPGGRIFELIRFQANKYR